MAVFHDAEVFLVGIGAQKSGTTWLTTALGQSPDVHVRIGEVHYWDVIRSPFSDWDRQGRAPAGRYSGKLFGALRKAGAPKRIVADLEHRTRHSGMFAHDTADHSGYQSYLCEGYDGQRVVFDNTPSYALCNRGTFAEMNALHENTRYLFIMRDPVRRLWAAVKHRHRFRLRVEPRDQAPIQTFKDALSDPFHPDRRRSEYARTLEELYSAVPAEAVTCLFFEDLFQQDTLGKVCSDLGIAEFRLPEKVVNKGVDVDGGLTDELAQSARQVLEPTYRYCMDTFGERVPEGWLQT